ncbi:hypothetical protein [Enterobacter bugandensis]|uniref:hypothetical protein n=1 Tax=Enterobacter bugandensis TaxID=881260 RepID=UPI001CC25EFD|nr:hypothetical protein [Enterobacter bugandensis]
MSVKRYYWDRKSDCDCEIVEQPDGAMVDYDEHASVVAALEARCAALAAENAGLNDKMNKLTTWPCIEFYASAWEFNNCDGHAALELLCDTKTPETDAFLAEVRAQGVEMFGQWLRDSADIFDKNSRHDWADQNRVSADKAGEFAGQLRKERQ